VAKPFRPLEVEEVLSELPQTVRLKLPSDPLDLKEKIDNALGVGSALLGVQPPDPVQIPSEWPNTPDLDSDPPQTESTGAFLTSVERTPAAWDFLVIPIAAIVFTLILVILYALLRS
jgi:hypothetical protein